MPSDLAVQIREELEKHPTHSWDGALWVRTGWVDEGDTEDEE
jgi:hypothetical protein